MLVKQPRQGILVGSMISIMYAGIDLQLVVKRSVQQLPPVAHPTQMGWLQSLYMLNLSKNAISGSIPSNLGNMSSFESLDLSFNSLDGKIPDTLASLDSLSVLNLAHNNLSGKVPSGPHFDTLSNEGSAYVGNHFLCGPSIGRSCQGPADADQSREAAEEHGGEEQWKIVVQGRSSKHTRVGEIMTEEVNSYSKPTACDLLSYSCVIITLNCTSQNKLITVTPDTNILQAMQLMTDKHIRHVPVIDLKVVGLISIVDVVKVVVEKQREEVKYLNEFIRGDYY
ncbi:hypothetical protein ACLOJK_001785 [Asimina triloba]